MRVALLFAVSIGALAAPQPACCAARGCAARINLAPHNPQSYVSTMASLHVDATTPSAAIQESTLSRTPWAQELFEGTGPTIKDGYADLPTRPGLGVTLNDKVAAQHPYKPANRAEYRFGDGSVTDQ